MICFLDERVSSLVHAAFDHTLSTPALPQHGFPDALSVYVSKLEQCIGALGGQPGNSAPNEICGQISQDNNTRSQ